jgi:transposase
MRVKRKRVDVNLEELDRVLDHAREAPLSEPDYEKLKEALHALAGMLGKPRNHARNNEKSSAVLPPSDPKEPTPVAKPKGHGRNGAQAYIGAKKIAVQHPTLHTGDACPGCEKGKVYPQKEPRALVRIVGQAPLAATVYELDRLRCNLCGEVFTAPEPEGIGPEKYDETTAAMIALLKYGSGMPFYRLEKLEDLLGIPLPSGKRRKAKCCTMTTPRCACCVWRVSHPMTAPVCSPPASCPHKRGAGSRCTSPVASTQAKIWAMCCITA